MKKKLLFLLFFCSLFLIFVYKQHLSSKKISKTRIALGTFIEISLEGNPKRIDKYIDTCFEIIEDLQHKLGYQNPKSDLSFINGCQKAPITPEIFSLLDFCQEFYLLSEKRFDPTVGALIDLWDFTKKRVPTPAKIKQAQKICGLEKVKYDTLMLIKPKNLKIHLGGVAKGFIMQKVCDYLQEKKIKSGYINAGGDISIFGNEYKQIGIAHPRQKEKLIDTIQIKTGAVVTSGDYERFFVKNGKRYHHIIDPISGYPSENCVSVTVVDSSILRADALATAYFLMPVEEAILMANRRNRRKSAVLIYYLDHEGALQSRESCEFAQYRMKKR